MFKNVTFPGVIASLFLFLLPFIYSRGLFYAGVNAKAFFVLACVYIIGIVFVHKLWNGDVQLGFLKKPIFWVLGGLLVIHYVASFAGIYPQLSFGSDILRSSGTFFLTHIVMLAVMLGAMLREADWILLRRTIIGSSVLFSLAYFLGSQGLKIGGRFLSIDFNMNGLTLGNETFAAAYVVLALVLLFIEIARTDSKKWKIWLGVLAGIQLLNPLLFNFKFWLGQVNPIADPLALVGSAKASSIVAWGIVGYLIIHWVIGKIKDTQTKKFVSWGHNGIWITGIVVGLVLLFVPGSFVQKKYVEISSGARIIVWESAEKAIAERSVLGFGPETYPIATQKYFDNRLHLQENIGEIWFDRAHNYFIDNLIAVGFVGLAVIIALFAFAIITVRKAFKDGKISRDEYVLWVIFVVAYVVQLQTSFETIATYVLWAVFVGYVLSLANDSEMVTQKHNPKKASSSNDDRVVIAQMVGAAVLLVVVIVGSSQLLFKESKRQHALVDIFRTKTDAFAQRQKLITTALSRTESFESIRVSSASFIKGMLEVMARGDMDPAFAKNALTELQLYENAYVKYLAEAPDDYRAQVNLAYVYFIKTFLGGENSIEKGRELVVSARELSPASPISYGMEALSYLYEGKIKQARELAQQAVAINPDIEFTHLIVEHIEKNAKTFPEISFLKLENL